MMLPQTKRGQEIERHRCDQIVIFRRTDIRAVMRVPGLETDAQTFLIIQRYVHISPPASMSRDRTLSMRPLVDRKIQRRRASGRIDRCVSVGALGKETRVTFRHRGHPSRPEPGMLARPKCAVRS